MHGFVVWLTIAICLQRCSIRTRGQVKRARLEEYTYARRSVAEGNRELGRRMYVVQYSVVVCNQLSAHRSPLIAFSQLVSSFALRQDTVQSTQSEKIYLSSHCHQRISIPARSTCSNTSKLKWPRMCCCYVYVRRGNVSTGYCSAIPLDFLAKTINYFLHSLDLVLRTFTLSEN